MRSAISGSAWDSWECSSREETALALSAGSGDPRRARVGVGRPALSARWGRETRAERAAAPGDARRARDQSAFKTVGCSRLERQRGRLRPSSDS